MGTNIEELDEEIEQLKLERRRCKDVTLENLSELYRLLHASGYDEQDSEEENVAAIASPAAQI